METISADQLKALKFFHRLPLELVQTLLNAGHIQMDGDGHITLTDSGRKIAERISGTDLETLARERIWKPLGMKRTQWNAPGEGPDEVELWFPNRPAGQHNDGVCFHCGFPLGSGSCFSTAGDLLLFVRDLLDQNHFPRIYYELLTTCGFEKNGDRRSFGWDMRESQRPRNLSPRTIYHTGWSGQTICADPESGFAAVVLTSRTGDHNEAILGRARIIEKLRS